ncbi:hypothetical protein M2302_004985 [Micromonospora sp. A200]|nr:hypothetical protein [Micromonospora sp. A200]
MSRRGSARLPTTSRADHLRLLQGGGPVTATRSSFDGRDSYYHLDLGRCANALADTGAVARTAIPPVDLRRAPRVGVLFVCTGNSARSPIAEARLRQRTGGQVEVASAGSGPSPAIIPTPYWCYLTSSASTSPASAPGTCTQ